MSDFSEISGAETRARIVPRLWPSVRWAGIALLLLLAFTAGKGVLYSSTLPPWWAPDEDYHWGYVNYLDQHARLPDPREPFYAKEYIRATDQMDYNQFGMAPAAPEALRGDPHALTKASAKWPKSDRMTNGPPTRPVVHAPLLHITAALVVKPFDGESVFEKIWLARLVSSAFVVLAVWAAWLLAAQVFRDPRTQLLVAGIFAMQPQLGFASGTLTNDSTVIAFFTLACGFMCFMLANAPNRKQGRYLGIAVGLALLSKATAVALLPLVMGTFVWQWWKHPHARNELGRSAIWTAGLCALIAGWFYAFMYLKYGSLFGNLVGVSGVAAEGVTQGLVNIPGLTKTWMQFSYATFWVHYLFWEAPLTSVWFWLPAGMMAIGVLGLVHWLLRVRSVGQFFTERASKAVFLLAAGAVMVGPFWLIDMQRALHGLGFSQNAGRFFLPAYAGAVCLYVIGVRQLIQVSARPFVEAIILVIAALECFGIWNMMVLNRYFGPATLSLQARLHRASFFRPEFITNESLSALLALTVLLGLLAIVATVFGERISQHLASRRQSQL